MIYRTARVLREIVGVAVGGLLVIAAALVWRLSTAPMEADFIRPYVEQEINHAGLGFTISVARAKLGWYRLRPMLDLNVHELDLLGKDGAKIGAFQDATLGISLRALLFGRVAVTEIDIQRPEIAILRDLGGQFSLRVGVKADEQTSPGGPAAETNFKTVIDRLLEPPDERTAIGHLRRVHLLDGRVTVHDRVLGLDWSAPDVDIDVYRSQALTTARISARLAMPGQTTSVTGDVRYDRIDARARAFLAFADFNPAAAAPLAAALAPLSALSTPVSGSVRAEFDTVGNLLDGDANLTGGEGKLVLPDFFPDDLAIRSSGLKLHFGGAPRRLTLEKLTMDIGDAGLNASGTIDLQGQTATIDMRAQLTNLPLARSDALWPHGFAVGGRDWVTSHIPAGLIKSGTVRVVATAKTDDPASLQPSLVDGAFDFSGLEVHYFPPLPPIKDISGRATFDSRGMNLTLERGALGDMTVSQGAIAITGFDRDDRAIDIGVSLDGPLKTALAVLDTKPLLYAHKLGFPPDAVAGHLAARANFSFPLIRTLPFSAITLGAKGSLSGVAVAGVIGPRDVTDGTMDIAVDKKGMSLSGSARLASVPVKFDWQESFEDSAAIRSQIGFRTELGDADRAALKFEPPPAMSLHGPIAVTGKVAIDRAHGTSLDATAELTRSDFGLDRLGLHKSAGEPGTAGVSLIFAGDTLRRIPRVRIDSPALKLSGSVDFTQDGVFQHAEFPKIVGGRSDYALTADAMPGGAFAVSVTGDSFNAGPLLATQPNPGPPSRSPRLDLTIDLGHILTGPHASLDQVKGSALLLGQRLDQANLAATAGGPIILTYQPKENGLGLHFVAADAGAALAALGLTGGVRGGVLTVDGVTIGGEGRRTTTGTIDLRDFRLTDAPIAARLVNALSLSGFVDLMSGQGLGFDALNSEFGYADGRITLRKGRTAGALGISFEGDVDLDRNKIALKGTVVPVDTFNRIIAAIPVLGGILTGGDRGGLIGWTYKVSGASDDPRVSVNPLSMFAPGFLRNLFFLGPSEPEQKPEAAPPAANGGAAAR